MVADGVVGSVLDSVHPHHAHGHLSDPGHSGQVVLPATHSYTEGTRVCHEILECSKVIYCLLVDKSRSMN